jgi:hypothetical protein
VSLAAAALGAAIVLRARRRGDGGA